MEKNKININDYSAVIFDMDGVLIDSEPLWKIAMEDVFQSIGANLHKKDFEKTVGLRIDEVISYWYEQTKWEGVSPKEVLNRILDNMLILIEKHGKPLIGVVETLSFLQKKGLKIGLSTSSYEVLIQKVIEKLEIKNFFNATHSAEKERYGKPHPDVYLHTAKLLNVSPLKCLVIEDSLTGIISGKAARMQVVCIPEKTHQINPKIQLADFIFESMKEFLIAIQ
ncbi:MAG: hexitol phosphatase HxpB [Flavobacteriia bacterium]|nr:hexitol phosphatase HxpB [Flavobacteriia bacterium]